MVRSAEVSEVSNPLGPSSAPVSVTKPCVPDRLMSAIFFQSPLVLPLTSAPADHSLVLEPSSVRTICLALLLPSAPILKLLVVPAPATIEAMFQVEKPTVGD